MRTEPCREWRESLGAYALDQLHGEERAALKAHMEGCPACRAEAASLSGLGRLLPHADPAHFGPAPQPPPELAGRVVEAIDSERRSTRRRRVRLGAGVVTAAAAAAATLAIFALGGGEDRPSQWVEFSALPSGVKIDARLEPRPFGTEIHMYVEGVRSGTLCQVSLRGPNGARMSAGTFRYRYGGRDNAVLASALDLSRASAMIVRVGHRTFVAPLGRRDPAGHETDSPKEET